MYNEKMPTFKEIFKSWGIGFGIAGILLLIKYGVKKEELSN